MASSFGRGARHAHCFRRKIAERISRAGVYAYHFSHVFVCVQLLCLSPVRYCKSGNEEMELIHKRALDKHSASAVKTPCLGSLVDESGLTAT